MELIIGNLRIYAALNNRQVTAHPCCEGRETEFRAQTIRPKTPARYNWSLQRLEPERQSPPIRSYSPAARKSPQTRDCVVVDAAQIEPVSTSNSLLAGNLAGNFLKKGPPRAILASKTRVGSIAYEQIPCSTEQGIFLPEQGILSREQGILRLGGSHPFG